MNAKITTVGILFIATAAVGIVKQVTKAVNWAQYHKTIREIAKADILDAEVVSAIPYPGQALKKKEEETNGNDEHESNEDRSDEGVQQLAEVEGESERNDGCSGTGDL